MLPLLKQRCLLKPHPFCPICLTAYFLCEPWWLGSLHYAQAHTNHHQTPLKTPARALRLLTLCCRTRYHQPGRTSLAALPAPAHPHPDPASRQQHVQRNPALRFRRKKANGKCFCYGRFATLQQHRLHCTACLTLLPVLTSLPPSTRIPYRLRACHTACHHTRPLHWAGRRTSFLERTLSARSLLKEGGDSSERPHTLHHARLRATTRVGRSSA